MHVSLALKHCGTKLRISHVYEGGRGSCVPAISSTLLNAVSDTKVTLATSVVMLVS